MVARHHDLLAGRFRLTTPPWDRVEWACDKRCLNELADDAGVAHPWTAHPRTPEEVAGLDCPFPVIVKPAVRESLNRLTSDKAWRADNRRSLMALHAEATSLLPPSQVMVQEIVPGNGDSQYSFAALCQEGVPVASVVARRSASIQQEFGRFSTFVESVVEPEVAAEGERLLKAAEYTGIVEIEFKREREMASFKVLDANPRVWGSHTLTQREGPDFSYLLWRMARGEKESAVDERGRGSNGMRDGRRPRGRGARDPWGAPVAPSVPTRAFAPRRGVGDLRRGRSAAGGRGARPGGIHGEYSQAITRNLERLGRDTAPGRGVNSTNVAPTEGSRDRFVSSPWDTAKHAREVRAPDQPVHLARRRGAIGPTLARVDARGRRRRLRLDLGHGPLLPDPGVGPPEAPMLEGQTALGFMAAHSSARDGPDGRRDPLPGPRACGSRPRPPSTSCLADARGSGSVRPGTRRSRMALGFPFPPLRRAVRVAGGHAPLAHAMWSRRERHAGARFDGHARHRHAPLNSPQSISRPRVPIIIGGGGERKTLRLVAQYADACNVFGGPEFVRAQVRRPARALRAPRPSLRGDRAHRLTSVNLDEDRPTRSSSASAGSPRPAPSTSSSASGASPTRPLERIGAEVLAQLR